MVVRRYSCFISPVALGGGWPCDGIRVHADDPRALDVPFGDRVFRGVRRNRFCPERSLGRFESGDQ